MSNNLRRIEMAHDEANGPHNLRNVLKALRGESVEYEITPPLKSTDKTVISFAADDATCARIKKTLGQLLYPEWPAARPGAQQQEAPKNNDARADRDKREQPKQESPQADDNAKANFFAVLGLNWKTMTSPRSGVVSRVDIAGATPTQRDAVVNLLNENNISASVVHSTTFNRDYIEIPLDQMQRLQQLAIAEQDWVRVSSPRSGDAYRIPASTTNPIQNQRMIDTLEQQGIRASVVHSKTFGADFIEVTQSQFDRLEQVIIANQKWAGTTSPRSGFVYRIDKTGMSDRKSDSIMNMLAKQGVKSSIVHSKTFNRDYIEVPRDSLGRLAEIITPSYKDPGRKDQGNNAKGPAAQPA